MFSPLPDLSRVFVWSLLEVPIPTDSNWEVHRLAGHSATIVNSSPPARHAIVRGTMSAPTKRDYVWNTLGVLLQNALSPLILVVISRENGLVAVGSFAFAFSVSIMFWAIGMWGGRTYQVSDTRGEFADASYIVARLALAACILVGSWIFCLANSYDRQKTSLIVVLVLFKAIESIADGLYGVLQVHGKLYIAGRSLAYKAVLGILTFTLVNLLTRDLVLASLGLVMANVVVSLVYDLPRLMGVATIHIDRHELRSVVTILRRSLPVFIASFLAMFSLNIPRYFIDVFHNEQNGYFGILAMPITLILLVMTFLLQPNVLRISQLYASGKRQEMRRLVLSLTALTAVVGGAIVLAAFLVGVPLLKAVFGSDFSPYRAELVVITVGAVLNALVSVGIALLTIVRRFGGQLVMQLSTNIILAILSYIAIKDYGMTAGVWLFLGISGIQCVTVFVLYGRAIAEKVSHD